jgi:hypothetical protein
MNFKLIMKRTLHLMAGLMYSGVSTSAAIMNRTLQRMAGLMDEPGRRPALMAGLMMGGFMAMTSAWGQPVYATPYTFITIAGTVGAVSDTNGNNGAGTLYNPDGVVVDTNDNLYVVDNGAYTIRKVAPAGGTNWSVSTIAGLAGSSGSSDGTGSSAQFLEPTGIALDSSNNLYVTDSGNCTVRKMTLTGGSWKVTTIAGTANPGGGSFADGTNGGAQFYYPEGIAVDAAGNLYVADTFNEIIRKIVPIGTNWVVTTIAGTPGLLNYGSADGTNQGAQFFLPSGIAVDSSSNLYVADGNNNTIRKIVPVGTNWVVSTIAGTASPGSGGYTDGTNGNARFNSPAGITVDVRGNLYVADLNNNAIREVSPIGTNWVTTTLAGDPNGNSGSTNGTGPTAQFNNPFGIAVDVSGNLFVGDTFNDTIRQGFVAAVPNLTIALTAANTVVVSWPGSGGVLQTNANLATANWGAYGGEVSSSNGTNSVTVSPAAGNLFFRLTQ